MRPIWIGFCLLCATVIFFSITQIFLVIFSIISKTNILLSPNSSKQISDLHLLPHRASNDGIPIVD